MGSPHLAAAPPITLQASGNGHAPEPKKVPVLGTDKDNSRTPIVAVKDVVKSFSVGGNELTILKGISFEVRTSEFVTIVGPSGNGKSTLLNMITGIDRPTHGEIFVTGQAVHKMSEDALAGWRGVN